MEFHQHIETKQGEIWIADATAKGFKKSETESRQDFEARFLSALLNDLLENAELNHESSGAPILKNHPDVHISISHSEQWFAVYLSNKQSVGIDIETQYDRIEKTQRYFLTEREINQLKPSKEELKICWGIKESVFKLFRGNVNSVKDEIQINLIQENHAEAICKNQNINLKFLQNKLFTLVHTD